MDETVDEGKECAVTSCRENKDSQQLELIILFWMSIGLNDQTTNRE